MRVDDLAMLDDLHLAFSEDLPALWEQDGTSVPGVTLIEIHDAADLPYGQRGSVRQLGYEVRKSSLPFEPRQDDIISLAEGAGPFYRVVEVQPYPEADAWRVWVEEA